MEDTDLDVIVVGAGIAGLLELYRLRNLGLRTRVLEAADDVGGTWFWNKYPGARCDVESVLYSYSFSPELQQEWTWTEKYASQPEILRYINHVADRFDLRRDISFNTRVETAVFNESTNRWEVNGTLTCQFLIMATGCLSAPKTQEIPGTERFRGASYHTAHWPAQGVDFANQRVAVIGTGSSAVQSIPVIAQQAQTLTVFQRTPTFAIPAFNRPLDPGEISELKARYDAVRDEQRQTPAGVWKVEPPTQPTFAVTEEARRERYESQFRVGSLGAFFAAFTDTITDRAANETLCEFVRGKIRDVVKDPVTAETLSPRTYAYGTKRPCLHHNYFESFNLPHVRLVDLRKTPIAEVTETGIRTTSTGTGDNAAAGTDFAFDTIVYATGYDAITGALTRIDVRGRGGVSLREKWATGVRSYLGVAVAGFPNMFTITGPLSPCVLSNMMISIEQHADWVVQCIAYMRAKGVTAIEAEAVAEDAWVAHADMVAGFTLYPSNTGSYYTGGNVVGKPCGRVMAYLGGCGNYRLKCHDVAAKGYEGFFFT